MRMQLVVQVGKNLKVALTVTIPTGVVLAVLALLV
jgi:hypothetical protein